MFIFLFVIPFCKAADLGRGGIFDTFDSNVKKLDLRSRGVTKLPNDEDFPLFLLLKELNLSQNKIVEGIEFDNIVAIIRKKLPSLHTLILDGDVITPEQARNIA